MATDTTVTGNSIEIEAIAADWCTTGADPNGLAMPANEPLRVRSITFWAYKDDDVLVIKNSATVDAAAATILTWQANRDRYTNSIFFGEKGKLMWPFIDYSECALQTASRVLIDLA